MAAGARALNQTVTGTTPLPHPNSIAHDPAGDHVKCAQGLSVHDEGALGGYARAPQWQTNTRLRLQPHRATHTPSQLALTKRHEVPCLQPAGLSIANLHCAGKPTSRLRGVVRQQGGAITVGKPCWALQGCRAGNPEGNAATKATVFPVHAERRTHVCYWAMPLQGSLPHPQHTHHQSTTSTHLRKGLSSSHPILTNTASLR